MGDGVVNNFDPAIKVDGKLLEEGFIALQSESHPIEFRKVELYDLAEYKDKPAQLASVLERLKLRTP